MTKEELDKRIDEMEGTIQDKIDYLDEWIFTLDMIDRWDSDHYKISSLLHQKKLELQELLGVLNNGC